jgi:L-alanine-DL-glutamate epimerase-like enolase superfamily enzyme
MKIVALETVRPALQPNLLFVLLHTDTGEVGLGEAFFGARAMEAYLHETTADVLFQLPHLGPELAARALLPYAGYQGGGVESRANGAVDLALWDLQGKVTGQPLVDLLGGAVRERVAVYNTCAGSGYVRTNTRQESSNWGLGAPADAPLEDLHAFLHRPAALARELWDEGLRGMKIWPFDRAAEATGGTVPERADLLAGLAVVEAIRAEVGLDMRLMVELHGMWSRRGATVILRELERFAPYWVEDPIRPDAVDALARLRDDVAVPIATGETVVGRRGFLPLLQRGAVDVVTVDLQWTGGLTEARKIAALADAYGVPVAPHDCTGPVTLAACVALTCSQPNGLIQETVRAFLRGWYAELVEGVPEVVDGWAAPGRDPGHGVRLHADLGDVVRVVSRR